MKTNVIFALFLCAIKLYSQSPISEDKIANAIETKKMSFEEINKEIEENFKNTDIKAKGSGWKVYQRWKYISSFDVDENGYLPNSVDNNHSIEEFKKSSVLQDALYAKSLNNTWSPAGPFNYTNRGSWSTGQGRINCSVNDPNNENIIYVGAANGGVWKSIDGGLNWSAKTDFIDSIGISGLAIDPSNTSIIYAMTGDADGRNITFNGLYKSTNAGESWTKMGLTGITYGRNILIDPTNSNKVIVATNSGVFVSTDGGINFTNTLNEGITYQILFKVANSNIVYASTSDNTNSYIYKSIDGGINWSLKYTLTGVKKVLMATTQADSNYLYLLGANTTGSLNGFKGVYLSTDSGETFGIKNSSTNVLESGQSHYDLGFAASQTNRDVVYTGCLNIWKSTNGGVGFSKQNSWNQTSGIRYTHADIHSIVTIGSNVYVGSDGGFYVSKDNGASFINRTPGLQISQFYKIDTAPNTNSRIVGGLQDNGGFASNNDAWINFYGADGMDVAIDPNNPQKAYGMIQYGTNMYSYDFNINANGTYVAEHTENGEWVTPLEISSASNIYAGWREIKELNGNTWVSKTSIDNGNNIRNIKVNPLQPNRLLFYRKGTDGFDELLYTNKDRNANGNLVPVTLNLPDITGTSKTISALCFNPVDPTIFYIVYNSRVFKTVDSGINWIDITYNFPSTTKFSIAAQGNLQNSVYVGTTFGVYYFDENSNTWSLFNTNLPRTRVTDLKINVNENNLTAGTYGRGIWRVALPAQSLSIEDFDAGKFAKVYPNPTQGHFKIDCAINESVKVAIYDATGKMVLERELESLSPDYEFNISHFTKGVYLLDIKSQEHTIRKKIVLE